MINKTSKIHLEQAINRKIQGFIEERQESQFLVLIYFAHIPFGMVLKLMRYLIGASKINIFSYLTVGFFLELCLMSLFWFQALINTLNKYFFSPLNFNHIAYTLIDMHKQIVLYSVQEQNSNIYLQEWFKDRSYLIRKMSNHKKTKPHASQKLKTV